jgi:hypothetical protein
MHIIWPLFCFFDADCYSKTSPPRRGCSAARRLRVEGLTLRSSLWQSVTFAKAEAEQNLLAGNIKIVRPQTSFLSTSDTFTHSNKLVESLLASRPHPTYTPTSSQVSTQNIRSTRSTTLNNIDKMSIPDPTSNYEEVEGVDVEVFRAYERFSLEESAEETGEDDIYGIGFGVPREGTSTKIRVV